MHRDLKAAIDWLDSLTEVPVTSDPDDVRQWKHAAQLVDYIEDLKARIEALESEGWDE